MPKVPINEEDEKPGLPQMQRRALLQMVPMPGLIGNEDTAGAGMLRKAANQNVSQKEIKEMVGPPKSLMDRIWDNYAKRMTPDEFLQSEPLWSGAKQMVEDGAAPNEHSAFASIANQIFTRMGANRFMTPEMARRYMGNAKGIKPVE